MCTRGRKPPSVTILSLKLGGWNTLNLTTEGAASLCGFPAYGRQAKGADFAVCQRQLKSACDEWRVTSKEKSRSLTSFGMTHTRKSKRTTEEEYRFAPKDSRRPSTVKGSGEWREITAPSLEMIQPDKRMSSG